MNSFEQNQENITKEQDLQPDSSKVQKKQEESGHADSKSDLVVKQTDEEPVLEKIPTTETSSTPETPTAENTKERKPKSKMSSEEKEDLARGINTQIYKTATSVGGVKFAADLVGAIFKKGDIYNYFKGNKDVKFSRQELEGGLNELLEKLKNQNIQPKETEDSSASEKKEEDQEKINAQKEEINNLRLVLLEKIKNNPNIPPAQKQDFETQIIKILDEQEKGQRETENECDQQIKQLIKAYIQNKISGWQIAKDGLNLALTAGALTVAPQLLALRGAMYLGTSALERGQKARQKYDREVLTQRINPAFISRGFYVFKDMTLTAAKETIQGLMFKGKTETGKEKSKIQKALSFAKSAGVIARALGIGGTAIQAFSEDGLNFDGFSSLLQAIEKKDFSDVMSQTDGAPEDLVADSTSTEVDSTLETTEVDSVLQSSDQEENFQKNDSNGANPESQHSIIVEKLPDISKPAIEINNQLVERAEIFNSGKALGALQDNEKFESVINNFSITKEDLKNTVQAWTKENPASGTISGILGKTMGPEATVTVINPDGSIIEDFDADLIHPGDTIAEKNGQIYVFKSSGKPVEAGMNYVPGRGLIDNNAESNPNPNPNSEGISVTGEALEDPLIVEDLEKIKKNGITQAEYDSLLTTTTTFKDLINKGLTRSDFETGKISNEDISKIFFKGNQGKALTASECFKSGFTAGDIIKYNLQQNTPNCDYKMAELLNAGYKSQNLIEYLNTNAKAGSDFTPLKLELYKWLNSAKDKIISDLKPDVITDLPDDQFNGYNLPELENSDKITVLDTNFDGVPDKLQAVADEEPYYEVESANGYDRGDISEAVDQLKTANQNLDALADKLNLSDQTDRPEVLNFLKAYNSTKNSDIDLGKADLDFKEVVQVINKVGPDNLEVLKLDGAFSSAKIDLLDKLDRFNNQETVSILTEIKKDPQLEIAQSILGNNQWDKAEDISGVIKLVDSTEQQKIAKALLVFENHDAVIKALEATQRVSLGDKEIYLAKLIAGGVKDSKHDTYFQSLFDLKNAKVAKINLEGDDLTFTGKNFSDPQAKVIFHLSSRTVDYIASEESLNETGLDLNGVNLKKIAEYLAD